MLITCRSTNLKHRHVFSFLLPQVPSGSAQTQEYMEASSSSSHTYTPLDRDKQKVHEYVNQIKIPDYANMYMPLIDAPCIPNTSGDNSKAFTSLPKSAESMQMSSSSSHTSTPLGRSKETEQEYVNQIKTPDYTNMPLTDAPRVPNIPAGNFQGYTSPSKSKEDDGDDEYVIPLERLSRALERSGPSHLSLGT